MQRKPMISPSPFSVKFLKDYLLFPSSSSVVCCVRFSADGRYLATGCNRTTQIYDVQTGAKVWYEWNWTDTNGGLNRPRANCCMFANGANLVGDWETGDLLKLDIDTYTDYASANAGNAGTGGNGPIIRVRTFPHSMENNDKVTYNSFDADMEPGTIADDSDPMVSLSWSDDKGKTYGNPVMQSMGKIGDYLKVISWNRLGQARDRVFKLSWSTNNKTALNGAFIEYKKASK